MSHAFSTWSPVEPIDQPCARISCTRSFDEIRVIMHFSEMVGGTSNDLEITFEGAIGLKWMEESSYSVSDTNQQVLEKCAAEKWRGWVKPMFVAQHSPWLDCIAVLPHTKSRVHYLLISSDDIVEILAEPNPQAGWVTTT